MIASSKSITLAQWRQGDPAAYINIKGTSANEERSTSYPWKVKREPIPVLILLRHSGKSERDSERVSTLGNGLHGISSSVSFESIYVVSIRTGTIFSVDLIPGLHHAPNETLHRCSSFRSETYMQIGKSKRISLRNLFQDGATQDLK